MGKEILSIPEENLDEVITIIRRGIEVCNHLTPDVEKSLLDWCDEMSLEKFKRDQYD